MKLIIFDLVGVIIPNLIGGSKKCMQNLYDSIPEKDFEFPDFHARYKKFKIGDIGSAEFWNGVEDYKEVEKQYLDTYTIEDNLDEIILPLKEKYTVVALSNHPEPWMNYIAEKFNFDKYFEKLYISGETKVSKPSKPAYELVLNDYNIDAEESIMIDDHNKNLIPASELGMKTIHVKRTEDPIEFRADAEVVSMEGIADCVDELGE